MLLALLRLIYTSEVSGDGCGDVRALTLVCKSNEGDGSGDRCVKEAKRKISFFVTSPSPRKSFERRRRRRRNKSADQNSRKILVKHREVSKQNKLLLSAGHYVQRKNFSLLYNRISFTRFSNCP